MKSTAIAAGPVRKDRLLHEYNHNPYQIRHKLAEPTVCPVCNAVFQGGRWQWAKSWPLDAHEEMCEACRRTKDNYPAGEVTLQGAAVRERKTELLNLARNLEERERAEHPLHRILRVEERPDRMVISTTDLHLARHIGEAVAHAHKGKLDWHYTKESGFVRVNWNSES